MSETLVRVQARHFTAGLTIINDRCTEAAPILRWCVGHKADYIRHAFKTYGWKATIVQAKPTAHVNLTREGILSLSKEERMRLEDLFGVAMINSIVSGNAVEFEGDWQLTDGSRTETP